MAKRISTNSLLYWGKCSSHTGALTESGDLILYWGKGELPSFTLKGAELVAETESHITVSFESPAGLIYMEGVGKYFWSTDKTGHLTIVDTKGRSLRISPQGDLEEEAFTSEERAKVRAEQKKVAAKKNKEKVDGIVKTGLVIAGVVYLLKLLFFK